MKTFHLDIVDPLHTFYSGDVEELTFASIDGSYGVLAGHAPTLLPLAEGLVRYKIDGRWNEGISSDGFVEIMPGYVKMLTMSIVGRDQVDVVRARRAKERAEENLKLRRSKEEFFRNQAALARALMRLKYAKRKS